MQLVGATNMYIRAPFICEGLLDGLFGAILAVIALTVARFALWPKMLLALPWVRLNSNSVDVPVLILELLLAGGAIGVVASWVSVGRHLRT
jgi:cell division transport system permease protein